MALLELASIRCDEERAREFVLARGGALERARLEGIFGATVAPRDVSSFLARLQNADGGFPTGLQAGAPSSLTETLRVLNLLRDLPPLAGSPMASRATAFIRRNQQVDGFWQESEIPRERLTAAAIFTILTLEPTHVDPVRRGSAWLKRALAGGQTPRDAATLRYAWAAWYKLSGRKAHEVLWAFERLQEMNLGAADLAGLLSCSLQVGAGGRFLIPLVQLLAELGALQQPDGSWPAEDALETTLTALRVMRGYGLF